MNKKAIENKARKLIDTDSKLWDKLKVRSGGELREDNLKWELYKKAWATKQKSKLPRVYYYIFEDANYHDLNKAFEELGLWQGIYGQDQYIYDKYRKAGGRTWKL